MADGGIALADLNRHSMFMLTRSVRRLAAKANAGTGIITGNTRNQRRQCSGDVCWHRPGSVSMP